MRAVLIVCALAAVAAAKPGERVVSISAKRFAFEPATVELKLGEPVVLALTSRDKKHGFAVADLGIDVTIPAKKTVRVRLVPDKAGTFAVHCSVFCGSGHEEMVGQIVVRP